MSDMKILRTLLEVWYDTREWCYLQWNQWKTRNDKRPTDVRVREAAAMARELLADEPADQFVHTALGACDKLEEMFPAENEAQKKGV